jgi:hypothetical protein
MMCDLPAWQGLSEDVCCHVVGWTVDNDDVTTLDDLANEMVSDIDVLGLHVVVVVDG